MRCKATRDIGVAPLCDPKLVTQNELGRPVIANGTVIDEAECPTADCVRLVKSGMAVPLDDECREACKMTDTQIAAAQAAVDKMMVARGVEGDEDDDDIDEEDE